MFFEPAILSLIVTRQCTASCESCCFGCSPHRQERLTLSEIKSAIKQAAEMKTFKVVVFTGGECFLIGDDLDEAVRYAADLGLIVRFVSNAFWATDDAVAMSRLSELSRVGLKEANFSTGEFHSRFVPQERVRRGAIAAARQGLSTCIMIECFSGNSFDLDSFLSHDEFSELINNGDISVRVSPWEKISGDRSIGHENPYMQAPRGCGFPPCESLLSSVSVVPGGDIYSCCGLTMTHIGEMRSGNLCYGSHAVADACSAASDDWIKLWIKVRGVGSVIQALEASGADVSDCKKMGHSCGICRWIYAKKEYHELIKKCASDIKEDLLEELVTVGTQGAMIKRPTEGDRGCGRPRSTPVRAVRSAFSKYTYPSKSTEGAA
jgi:hypothetical protein